jgi:AcrR family transcriptional regulator
MPLSATDRHDRLLDELVGLFLGEGFREFTLADLAERLHCSKTTLYALGHSKEQVTVNAVIRFFTLATASVEAATAMQTEPAARIVAYLRAVADALRPASTAFMADLAAHPATRAVYERNTIAAALLVGELIDEGIAAERFRHVHGAFVADTVAATMRRIQTGEVLEATGMHDAAAYDELAALVLNGIRSRPPSESSSPVLDFATLVSKRGFESDV